MSEDEVIVPEYVPEWHNAVERLLNERFSPGERVDLFEKVIDAFEEGMCSYQSARAVQWLNDCVDRAGLSRSDLSQKLNVDRAHIGRWLTGENDLPFRRLQRFYVTLALPTGAGMPLNGRDELNLGGYQRSVGLIQARLKGESEETDFEELSLETLLCLHQFYATTDTIEHYKTTTAESNDLAKEKLAEAQDAICRFVPESKMRIRTIAHLKDALTTWGVAWLACVRVLAEEEDGVREHYISAKRAIRLNPLNRDTIGE